MSRHDDPLDAGAGRRQGRMLVGLVAVAVISAASTGPAWAAPGGQPRAGADPAAGTPSAAGVVSRLLLSPGRAFIAPGGSKTYRVRGVDDKGRDLGDLTARAHFSIRFSAGAGRASTLRLGGSCAVATCTASALGRHTVTAVVSIGARTVRGTAQLQVVPRPRAAAAVTKPPPAEHRPPTPVARVARLAVTPAGATIRLRDTVTYSVEAMSDRGRSLGDVTRNTQFSIAPDGSCTGARCTPAKAGPHVVTAILVGTSVRGRASLRVLPVLPPPTNGDSGDDGGSGGAGGKPADHAPDGGSAHGSGAGGPAAGDPGGGAAAGPGSAGPPAGPRRPETGGGSGGGAVPEPTAAAGSGSDPGSAAGAVDRCAAQPAEVRVFAVEPATGAPGTRVHIVADVSRRLAGCGLLLQLGAAIVGGPAVVASGGAVSEFRTVPVNAPPGVTVLRLATNGGRVLARASFEVLPAGTSVSAGVSSSGAPGVQWSLAVAGPLVLALLVAGSIAEWLRRQRRWVHQHLRIEPRPGGDESTVHPDAGGTPVTLRLRPHLHSDTRIQIEEHR